MKKVLLVFTLAAVTLGACNKKQSTDVVTVTDTVYTSPKDTTKPIDTSLTISGIKDVRTDVWGNVTLNVTVNRNSGAEQKVTMKVTGLPAKTKAEWSSVSGYTTFNTFLSVKSMFATPGVYPLTVTSETADGKTMDYNVNMMIDTPTTRECDEIFYMATNGALSTTDPLLDSIVATNTFIILNNMEGKLFLSNMILSWEQNNFTKTYRTYMPGSNEHVAISFDCNSGLIKIAEQDVTGRAFSGGSTKTFKIYGEGKIDVENNTYEITYITEHDDNGTNVIKSFTTKGQLDKL